MSRSSNPPITHCTPSSREIDVGEYSYRCTFGKSNCFLAFISICPRSAVHCTVSLSPERLLVTLIVLGLIRGASISRSVNPFVLVCSSLLITFYRRESMNCSNPVVPQAKSNKRCICCFDCGLPGLSIGHLEDAISKSGLQETLLQCFSDGDQQACSV